MRSSHKVNLPTDNKCFSIETIDNSEKITIKMKFFGVDERFVGKRKYDVTCGRTNFPVYWAREATMEKAYFEDDETSFLVVLLAKKIGKPTTPLFV